MTNETNPKPIEDVVAQAQALVKQVRETIKRTEESRDRLMKHSVPSFDSQLARYQPQTRQQLMAISQRLLKAQIEGDSAEQAPARKAPKPRQMI